MANGEIGKVYAVDAVQITITRTKPPFLIIHASGRVPTTGWSAGELSRYVYLQPPKDRVQDFDFNARMPKPGDVVLEVLTPISAHIELPNIDVENYWGRGVALAGVRVHAVANSKTVDVVDQQEAARLSAAMSPRATASYTSGTQPSGVPSFEQDIKPLFRAQDVVVMQALGGFNLHKYEDVKNKADRILQKLRIDMPCDGLWPAADIAKFEAWKNGGMPA